MALFSFIKSVNDIAVKLVIYLDAGKGNARGAVVQIRNGKPHILYTILGEQRVGNSGDSLNTTSLSSLEEILGQVARLLQKSRKGHNGYVAEEVFCVLAAPYYLCHTSIINFKGEKPVTVTPALIKNLLLANHKEIPEAHSNANLKKERKILHQKVIEIKINGYHTSDPYNKLAEEINVAVFRTEVETNLYDNITKMVKKFTAAPLSIEPLSLATFVALRNRLDSEDNFIFITIGNEVTEISLVKDHTVLETASFPYGKYSLGRSLGQRTNMPPDAALSKIGLYHDKKLDEDEMAKLKPIVEEIQAEWFSYLEKTLVTLSEETSLPSQIYLIIDSELKDIFENMVTARSFASQALVPTGFSIHTLDTAKFADCCTFGLDIRFDTLIAISASFAASAKEALPDLYPQELI